jgi:hypothetical protein
VLWRHLSPTLALAITQVLLQLAAYSSPGVDGDVGADSEAKNFISLAIYKVRRKLREYPLLLCEALVCFFLWMHDDTRGCGV